MPHWRVQYTRTPSRPCTQPPSMPFGQRTSGCMSASALPRSRALNAAYASLINDSGSSTCSQPLGQVAALLWLANVTLANYRGVSTLPSASNRSVQYCLSCAAASRLGSFVCCTATELLASPFGRKPTATMVPSSKPSRADLGAVAVRSFTSGNQRLRSFASANASNNCSTGTLYVFDFDAS